MAYQERGNGWMAGESGTFEEVVPALRPVKTEKAASHRQNNMLKRWGPRPSVRIKQVVYSAQ